MNSPWAQHQACLLLFLLVLLAIAVTNLRRLRRLGEYPVPSQLPTVSVLVPARNEVANIGPCVSSLLAQRYPHYEVLVLDDDSTDGTARVLASLRKRDGRFHVLRGEPLPPGWLGKHWACHQLAKRAEGDLLLFTDADTRHHPHALRDAVAALGAEKADLLTAFPKEDVVSWAERLLVPILHLSFLSLIPLHLAYRLRAPMLSATIGQFMLFRRDAYEMIGGHAAVRQHAADDLALGRRIKAAGLRWRVADGGARVSCRMYRSFRQVYDGFGKNLFATFEYNVPLFLLAALWLGLAFLEPPAVLALKLAGVPLKGFSTELAALSVLASLLLWGISHRRFRVPIHLALFYPASVLLMILIALRSMVLTLNGRATWKGRTLVRHPIRWW